MIRTVPVALGDRSYEVRIGPGLIDQAGAQIAPLLSRPRAAILTDETVAARHLPRLLAALKGAALHLPVEERWYRAGDRDIGVRQFVVADPDGYLLRFSEPLGSRPHAL